MWAPGMGELLVILIIVLVIFGAGKLRQVGGALGGAINEFRTSVKPEDDKEEEKTDTSDSKSNDAPKESPE